MTVSDPFSSPRGSTAVDLEDEDPRLLGASLAPVLKVAGRLYGRVAEALDRVGLTPPQYELLSQLRTDGPVTLAELADRLRRPPAEVSPLVDALARDGLVRGHGADGAGDAVGVTLTPLGSERTWEGRAGLDVVLSEFTARVGLEDRLTLDRLLSKLER